MQNSDTSMGVGSLLFLSFTLVEQVHPCQLGALHLWDPCWLTQSTLGQMVHADFNGELGTPSSQLSVGQSTGNASFSCGTGVGSSLDLSPPTGFSPSSCSRLLLMGKMGYFCAGYGCILPIYKDVPHILVGSGRVAILTTYSLFSHLL